jgi:hypothetical protein
MKKLFFDVVKMSAVALAWIAVNNRYALPLIAPGDATLASVAETAAKASQAGGAQ